MKLQKTIPQETTVPTGGEGGSAALIVTVLYRATPSPAPIATITSCFLAPKA